MTTFSQAQYDAVIHAVTAGTTELAAKIAALPPAANDTLTNDWVPDVIKTSIRWLVDRACAIGTWLLDTITDLLKGAIAPIRMLYDSWQWMDVRRIASGVAGTLKDTNLTVDDMWQGPAKDAYVKHMKTHSDAASRCATIADKTAICLTVCAGAGLAFYVALGVILSKVIAEFAASIAAVSSGVFSAAGAYVIITDAGITSGMIWAAIAALTALLGAQANQMIIMHGEATDGTMFPAGTWPIPGTQNYHDASMLDGDTTDWYLEQKTD